MVVLTKIGKIPEKPDRNTQYLGVTACQRVGPCSMQDFKFVMVRGKGVEPLTKRWQRLILPLN